jgi:hypothetical protein
MSANTINYQNANHEFILTRRSLRTEPRPSRNDMLRLFSEGGRMPVTNTVCTGQCIYCDSDDGGDGDA